MAEEKITDNMEELENNAVSEDTEETPQDAGGDRIQELEFKVREWEEKYVRLYAEYDNYQKRSKREKDASYADAAVDIIAEILPIADNLDRALAVEVQSEEAKSVLEGVEMVKKQMLETFSKLGVNEIKALGEEFDPNLHDAVMHIEDENVTDNTVVEEFMKGYRYKEDRVIRHSMVKVAN